MLLWADLETDGLNPWENRRIFEVGLVLTDLDLNIKEEAEWTIWHPGLVIEELDPFIQDMHTKNGLLEDMHHNGLPQAYVELQMIKAIQEWGIQGDSPLCGSSLRLDRNFLDYHMPRFHKMLSYRTIDVSSFKETVKRYKPDLYEAYLETHPDDGKAHRVLGDIRWSINEYRFYLEGLGIL